MVAGLSWVLAEDLGLGVLVKEEEENAAMEAAKEKKAVVAQ